MFVKETFAKKVLLTQSVTVSKVFGVLVPDSQDLKVLFSFVDFGFKR